MNPSLRFGILGAAKIAPVAMEAELRFPDGLSANMKASMEDHEKFSATLLIDNMRLIDSIYRAAGLPIRGAVD